MTNREAQDDWQHLKPYGYAPGNYMAKCYGCEKVVEFVDKRATRCRPCAEALHIRAQQASTQPEQAQEAIPEELVCPECDEGFVLGSRVWLACSKCHGSGRTDRLGDCVPGTRRKKDKTEAETSATASVAGETVPWPVVTRYSGGGSPEGVAGHVWVRLGDGHEETEYVRAASVAGLSAAAPAVASSAMEAIRRYAWDFAQHAIHHTDSTKAAADRSLAVVNVTLTTHREHPAAQQALADMEARKDAAYEERNRCVALIARMAIVLGFKAGVTRTAIEGWSEDWHGCVYVELPTGQASWHFHDSQAYLFEGLPSYEGKWDGHTTPQKYERVGAAFSPAAQQERQEARECRNCAHWQPADEYETGHSLGVGRCGAAPMLWDSTEWDDEGEARAFTSASADKTAFVQDGSDYIARLYTKPQHGCTMWIAAQAQKEKP
jgi:hypothetical protein